MAIISALAPLEPTTRDDVRGIHDLVREIGVHLEEIPHGRAKAIHRLLGEVRSTFDEKLPGGFYGHCEACNTVLGNDDDFVSGDEVTICRDCVNRYEAEMSAANVSTIPAKESEHG